MVNKAWSLIGLIFACTLLIYLLIFEVDYFASVLVLPIVFVFFKQFFLLKQLTRPMQKEQDKSAYPSEINVDAKQVVLSLKSMSSLIAQQVAIVDIELNRANSFVANAAADIASNVKCLKSLSEHQQSLIKQIIATSSEQTQEKLALIDQLSFITPKVSESVVSAVRSLQFEDFTHQTLMSVKTNLKALLALNLLLDKIDNSPESVAKQLLNLQKQCQDIQLETARLDIKRSVSQVTLDEGGIELF